MRPSKALHPVPRTSRELPPWFGRLMELGEVAKDDARSELHAAIEAGTFSDVAAEELIKALWCRAFGLKPHLKRNPDWRTYGRMLLADPDLAAFYSHPKTPEMARRIRVGVEGLCGGGPLPGLKPGFTYVFDACPVKVPRARRYFAPTTRDGRTGRVPRGAEAASPERFIGVAQHAHGRAPYPGRATALRPEEQAEFGVETAHELVAMLNAAWARSGRRALAPGSYPTTRILLKTVLRELRIAKAEGLLDR